MTAKEVIAKKIKKFREEKLEKIIETYISDLPESEHSEWKDIFLTSINVSINQMFQERSNSAEKKIELLVQQIAVQTMFCEENYKHYRKGLLEAKNLANKTDNIN